MSSSSIDTSVTINQEPVASLYTASLYSVALRLTLIAIVFAANIDIARADRSDVELSITPQAIVKLLFLGLLGVLGAWGWWKSGRVRQYMMSVPGLMLIALGFCHFLAVPFSQLKTTALAGAIAYTTAVLGVAAGVVHIGTRQMLVDMMLAFFAYVIISIVFYAISPENGTFIEVLDATTKVPRLSGLGHPNILGRNCCFVILFFIMSAVDRKFDWRWCLFVVPVFAGICLAALSRTPMISMIVVLGIMSLALLRQTHGIYLFGLAALLALFALFALEIFVGSDQLLDKIVLSGTKTGDVSEVTTATGRTAIWLSAIELIKASPVFGHGCGSLPLLMVDNSGHAHNILLSPTAQLGIPAGLLVLALLIWNLATAFASGRYLFFGTVMFIVVVGLVESPLLGPLPDGMTFFWIALCFWPLQLIEQNHSREAVSVLELS